MADRHSSEITPSFWRWWNQRRCRKCGQLRYNHPFGKMHPCSYGKVVPSIVNFASAQVGDHAYTWEYEDGDMGDYRFETAGDPRNFHDDHETAVIRKRWKLVEVVELPCTLPDAPVAESGDSAT